MKKILFRSCFGIMFLGSVLTSWLVWKPVDFEANGSSGLVVQCERGQIEVPELRDGLNTKTIDIDYVKLKSFSDNPGAPIFYLAGGPGNDASSQAENSFYIDNWAPYLETRDVILVDQRGVNNKLLWWINLCGPNDNVLVTEEDAERYFQEISRRAKKAYDRRGINLAAYNSIESAHDLDDLRSHLGYEKIIPMGFSYGTHLGLSYSKYYEENIDKMVLIGVEGLNQTYKKPLDLDRQFAQIGERLSQDSVWSKLIPDLNELYLRVSKSLEEEPIVLEIKNPIGIKKDVRVGKFGLDFILKRDLGDASDIPQIPKMLYGIEQGNYGSFAWYVQKRYREFYGIPGMTLAMDVASGLTEERKNLILEEESKSMFGGVSNFPFLSIQDEWGIPDLGDEYRQQDSISVPILLLSGTLDSNTPAHQGDSLLSYAKHGTHIVSKDAGHEQIQFSRGMNQTIRSFLAGKDVSQVEISYRPLQFNQL